MKDPAGGVCEEEAEEEGGRREEERSPRGGGGPGRGKGLGGDRLLLVAAEPTASPCLPGPRNLFPHSATRTPAASFLEKDHTCAYSRFGGEGTVRRDGAAGTAGIRTAPSPGQESLASSRGRGWRSAWGPPLLGARDRPRAPRGAPPGAARRGGGSQSGNGGRGSPAARGDPGGRGAADSPRRPRRGSPGRYFRLEHPGFQRRRAPAPAGRLALWAGDAAVRVRRSLRGSPEPPGPPAPPRRPRAAPGPRLPAPLRGASAGVARGAQAGCALWAQAR
ncbi:collagen alpha-1(I) chain-like [Ursus americanus]|uniref:collagen alpha-1(I) chain-like n=1 Tax=Ursus americanus TaxID=9643 RepID=UPI001E67A830|nr:collagen alpha-1(I) chain-like [Ursus americanus]XP_045658098.1 collagen alpha-1(I) chain-like [Ursus americanus]XP_045658099.1 collagen alpha-1(I) chain-like [Ursus americanus]XP_045658100.1 collagen alpha-1(I) chain-like [Ursus americanus]XP_045658101.1 collagen alpha-1(I) chain-like [Ursus americanus]XP_045658102.1 collagen alpha-1(I) chain-like [Ursus americanus]XP_045658103.1 collagen alpha-1(I) chain-like [Ursus americanus]